VIEPVDSSQVEFRPTELLTALGRSGVEFVVIGGIAAVMHGDDASTSDADTTVRRTRENLVELVGVLDALDAKLLVQVDERTEATIDVPVTVDTFQPLTSARFLTRYGVLDVVLRPDGVSEFDEWVDGAHVVEIADGVTVLVAGLDQVIASKEAAGRRKDEYALPRLRVLRDRLRKGPPPRHGFGAPHGQHGSTPPDDGPR
jgi:predicted nucleotidyltransferase